LEQASVNALNCILQKYHLEDNDESEDHKEISIETDNSKDIVRFLLFKFLMLKRVVKDGGKLVRMTQKEYMDLFYNPLLYMDIA